MIKGSLLCSIPIVKRIRAKIFEVQEWPENWWFWGLGRKKINPNNDTPSKSIPSETRYLPQNGKEIL